MNTNQFEIFKQKAKGLCGKIEQLEELFDVLLKEDLNETLHDSLTEDLKKLQTAKKKLSESSFKTLVIGEFKRGKSTFINALLQEKVLPAYATPCTAVINEVKWGQGKKATIYFEDKFDNLPPGLSPTVLSHIESHGKTNVPPLEVGNKEFQQCVIITDPGMDQAEGVFKSPFKKAVIEYPLDICKSGVEIIDSPGLNEHKTRNDITTNYLGTADAIIFVLLCDPLASASEMKSISEIYNMGHKSIFYVCNRFDNVEPEDRPRVMDFARQKLIPFTDLGEEGLHFVSSKNALDFYTKIPPDSTLLEKSGFVPMRKSLEHFLVNNRGRLKLRQPCETATALIEHQIGNVINAVLSGLDADIEQLKVAHANLIKKVQKLREHADLEKENLQGKAEGICVRISSEASGFVNRAASKASDWVHECEPATSLGVIGGKAKVEAIVNELSEYALHCLEAEKEDWENNHMRPLLEQLTGDFNESCRKSIASIGEDLKDIKNDFDGNIAVENNFCINFNAVTGIESSALSGALITTVSAVLAGLGGALLGLICPWMLLPAIIAAIFGGGLGKLLSNESRMNEIKDKVGEILKQKIREEGLGKIADVPEPVRYSLLQQVDNMFDGVKHEIDMVEGQANEKLKLCQEGEELRRQKGILFDKINAQKEELLSDFKKMLDELSNPSYQISEGGNDDLFSQLAKISSSASSAVPSEPGKTMLVGKVENASSVMVSEQQQEAEKQLKSFERSLQSSSIVEKVMTPQDSPDIPSVKKEKRSFFQRLLYFFIRRR